ncbi:MAG: VWA domain-containing protein [Gemmatimonadetes bacterium]|nr:VWA domain-containing protein [Gemmatimonadota bacterium]
MFFSVPMILGLLAALPVLLWWYRRQVKGRRGGMRFSDISVVSRLKPASILKYRHVPFALRAAAIGLAILALARPQTGTEGAEVMTEGIDIVLALDISGSMGAEDYKPRNRLYVAKSVISDFIRERKNDRIGMVVFAGRSFTQCPLTLDYDVLLGLLDQVEIGLTEDGTAIGMGIANSVNRLRQSSAESKVVILLTDGVNNTGAIDPVTAAKAAKALGVRIYSVGIGKEEGAPIPVDDPVLGRTYARNRDGSLALTEIDEETLRQVAEITGGYYFKATDGEMLSHIYQRIDALERTEMKVIAYSRYTELFGYFLLPAMFLVLAETLLKHTRFRKLP